MELEIEKFEFKCYSCDRIVEFEVENIEHLRSNMELCFVNQKVVWVGRGWALKPF